MDQPQALLEKIAERLQTVLDPARFEFQPRPDIQGHGRIAVGYFVRGPFRIGVMVRGAAFESVLYEWGGACCAHWELVRALGHEKDAMLRSSRENRGLTLRWRLFRRARPDVVEALVSDLQNIIMPALEKNPEAMGAMLEAIQAEQQQRAKERRIKFSDRACRHCGQLLNLGAETGIEQSSEEPWRIQCANCGEELTPDDVRP